MRVFGIVRVAVQHGKRYFRQLHRHAAQPHDPHPEHGPGAAQADSQRNPADIAQAYRRRKRRGQSLKVRNGPGIVGLVVISASNRHSVRQGAVLAETAPDGKQDTCAQYRVEHPVVPDDGIQRIEKVHHIHGIHSNASAGMIYEPWAKQIGRQAAQGMLAAMGV